MDMHLKNKNAPAFLICAEMQCAHMSNGILGLVHLAKAIKKLGREAHMCQIVGEKAADGVFTADLAKCAPQTDSAKNSIAHALNNAATHDVHFLTDFSRERIESSYVVYPDSLPGNPLNAPNVIRFFGNRDGVLTNGIKVERSSNDFLVTHSRVMTAEAHHVCCFTWMNPLFNRNGTKPARDRSLDLSYVGKGLLYGFNGKVKNSVVITRSSPGSKEELAILLRNCRFFYTADACSQINNEALACGAIPVFMHYGPWTEAQIDGFEAGVMPRLRMGQTLSQAEFERFEVDRQRYLAGLATIAQGWDSSVEQLIDKADRHFAAISRVGETATGVVPKLPRRERKRWRKPAGVARDERVM